MTASRAAMCTPGTLLIPEGYNIFDIAQAVEQAGLGSQAEFLKAEMRDTALIARWRPHADSLEGYLFPDTYRFSPRLGADGMLAAMVKRFGVAANKLHLRADEVSRVVNDGFAEWRRKYTSTPSERRLPGYSRTGWSRACRCRPIRR